MVTPTGEIKSFNELHNRIESSVALLFHTSAIIVCCNINLHVVAHRPGTLLIYIHRTTHTKTCKAISPYTHCNRRTVPRNSLLKYFRDLIINLQWMSENIADVSHWKGNPLAPVGLNPGLSCN